MILYPAYLDSRKSTSEGRRVPLDDAVPDPSAEEVAKAVKQIGYDPVVERDKQYPRSWWENKGRVRVEQADDSKRDMLGAVAVYVRAMRDEGEE